MHAEQEKLQGATARAQERASQVMGQNEQRLESAFWLLSLVLTILGSFILYVPDKASPWRRPHLVLPVCNSAQKDHHRIPYKGVVPRAATSRLSHSACP